MIRNKIVHAYFTNGYVKWARVFVESFRLHNDHKLILSTRNLSPKKIASFERYRNVEVRNKDLDFEYLAEKAEIGLDDLYKFKNQTEGVKVSNRSLIWKLMIAGDDRPKEVREVVNSLDDGDLLLHLDIDSYFKGSIDHWFDIIEKNDFTAHSRYKNQMRKNNRILNEDMVIIICVMGFTIGKNAITFLDEWMKEIDDRPVPKRKRGYGQTSCYRALKKMEPFVFKNYSFSKKLFTRMKYLFLDESPFKFGVIPSGDLCLGGNLNDCGILYGANRGPKSATLRRFVNDLEKIKK